MGRGPTNENTNMYFQARKKAATYNERLWSREGAAELLGISVSTLADYELGNTKVVPVDKVVLMADLYNAPELITGYCMRECPVHGFLPLATEEKSLEELNKLIKAIEERRKQVKNIINEPYAVFEAELKEITALINEPVALIDQQVKAFEEKQKEEKKAAIKATYDENIGDLAEVLPFEKIFDSRYLNQTYKLATAQKEIVDKIDTVKTDLETIDSLDSKYKLNAKDVYIKTLDLSKALAENKRLADLEEKLEADKRRKAEEEAERKRQEEIRKQKEAEEQAKREAEEAERKAAEAKKAQEATAEVEQTEPQSEIGKVIESSERSAFSQAIAREAQAAPTEQAVDPFAPKEEPKQEKKYRVRFFADGTKEQLGKLIAFMNENNIKYGKIAKESK